jgi:hypothetical protein
MGVLLGAVLVASVGNGLDLLGLSGNFKSIATGLVLLSAVCLDMVLRRGRGYSSGGDFTPTPIPSKSGQGELEDRAAGRVGASP